jgi:hypothetical protein
MTFNVFNEHSFQQKSIEQEQDQLQQTYFGRATQPFFAKNGRNASREMRIRRKLANS